MRLNLNDRLKKSIPYVKTVFFLFDTILAICVVGSLELVVQFQIIEADALYGEVYNASNQPLSVTSNKMDFVNTSVIIACLCKIQIKNMLQQRRLKNYC